MKKPPENPSESPAVRPEQKRERAEQMLHDLAEKQDQGRLNHAVLVLGTEPDIFALALEQSRTLPEQQRAVITQNLERLTQQTSETEKEKRESIERLKKEFAPPTTVERPAATSASSEAAPAAAPSSAPDHPEQGFWARNWEQAGKYWNEASPTVKAAGVGVGVAILAYGVYRFGRWLWGGTKQAAEKTKEGMGWFGKSLLIGGGLVIAGVAGYLGFKALEKYMKEMVGDLKDAAKEKVLAAKRMAEEQLVRVEDALQRGGEQAREHLDDLKEEKRKLTEKIAEYDRALQERRAESAQPASVGTNGEPVGRPQGEQVREEAEDLMKAAGTRLLARGLLAIYPAAPELGTIHESQVNDFIHANQDRPLHDLFACVHADPAQAEAAANDVTILPGSVTVLEEDRERREAAAKYVILLCWDKRQSLLASREDLRPEDVDAMTMKDFVQAFAQGAEAVAGIIDTVVAAEGDPKKLRELLDPEKLYLASGAEGELALLISESRERLGLSAQALQNIHPLDVMKFALRQGGVTARGFGTTHQSPGEGQDAGPTAVLASVCAAMEDETPKFMLPFFHKIFPDHAWSTARTENLEHVRTILMDRMPLSQSVRLYLYQRMMQRGNPVGILLMQAEIFKYVASQDERLLKDAHSQMILAMGEVSLRALASEGEWPELPPDAMENGQRLLGFLTEKGAKAALLAAVAVPREGLAWFKSAYARYPLAITPVALVSGYVAKIWSDIKVKPARVLFQVSLDVANTESAPLPVRALRATLLRPWNARPLDVQTAEALLMDGYGDIKKISGINKVLGRSIADAFTRVFRGLDSKRSWQKFADFLTAKRSSLSFGDPAFAPVDDLLGRARKIIADSGVRKSVRLASRPRINVLLTDKLAAGANVVRDAAGATVGRWGRHWMNEWRTASTGARAAYVAGVGIQALALYGDYMEIGEIEKQRDSAVQHAGSVVDRLRQDLERDRTHFERVSYGVYRHKVSGVEISLRGLQRQIDTHVGGTFDERELAQKLRTVNTGAGLATTILIGAKAFTGPAGLVIAGVEITIRTGINAWEQSKMRTFLNDAPPWLLAVLGAQETTGEGEYDWLEKASGWMLSDMWPSSRESAMDGNKDKPELRKRMLYSIFVRELMQHVPEAFTESVGGMWSPEILDRFYREDFTQFILPTFSVMLFASAKDESISWQAARQSEIGVHWAGLIPPDVTLLEVREAMRRSAVLYLQHIRERRYLEYRALLQTIPVDDPHRAAVQRLVTELSDVHVLGSKLREADQQVLERNNGKTRAEIVLQTLQQRLMQAPGKTRTEKSRQNAQLSVIEPTAVAGLSSTLDFTNRDQLFDLVGDPTVSLKLRQLIAQTLGEEEAEKRNRWNDWGPQLQRVVTPESWMVGLDRMRYAAPFHAANVVAEALGQPLFHQNTSPLDVLRRSADAASYDAARDAMTDGAIELFRKPEISRRAFAQRWTAGAGAMYGENGPLVFGEYRSVPEMLASGNRSSADQLYHLLRYPDVEAQGFEPQNLRAVFFEGRMLKSGHEVVLATYIYGDIASRRISVLRCAGSTYQVAGLPKDAVVGSVRPVALADFLQERGAQDMLRRVQEEMETARKAQEHRAQESRASTEQAVQGRKEQASERVRHVQERERQRTQLREQFRGAGVLGFVPGSFIEREKIAEQDRAFYEGKGNIEGRISGADVSFELPPEAELDGQPVLSTPASQEFLYRPTHFKFRAERDGKPKEYDVILGWMRDPTLKNFSPEDLQLIREVLITPVDLSAHPRGKEPIFIEGVRKFELRRLLKMADYRSGAGWSAHEYENHLFDELWPAYRDAEDKRGFLNQLLNNLLSFNAITGGVFSSPYRTILKNMKG